MKILFLALAMILPISISPPDDPVEIPLDSLSSSYHSSTPNIRKFLQFYEEFVATRLKDQLGSTGTIRKQVNLDIIKAESRKSMKISKQSIDKIVEQIADRAVTEVKAVMKMRDTKYLSIYPLTLTDQEKAILTQQKEYWEAQVLFQLIMVPPIEIDKPLDLGKFKIDNLIQNLTVLGLGEGLAEALALYAKVLPNRAHYRDAKVMFGVFTKGSVILNIDLLKSEFWPLYEIILKNALIKSLPKVKNAKNFNLAEYESSEGIMRGGLKSTIEADPFCHGQTYIRRITNAILDSIQPYAVRDDENEEYKARYSDFRETATYSLIKRYEGESDHTDKDYSDPKFVELGAAAGSANGSHEVQDDDDGFLTFIRFQGFKQVDTDFDKLLEIFETLLIAYLTTYHQDDMEFPIREYLQKYAMNQTGKLGNPLNNPFISMERPGDREPEYVPPSFCTIGDFPSMPRQELPFTLPSLNKVLEAIRNRRLKLLPLTQRTELPKADNVQERKDAMLRNGSGFSTEMFEDKQNMMVLPVNREVSCLFMINPSIPINGNAEDFVQEYAAKPLGEVLRQFNQPKFIEREAVTPALQCSMYLCLNESPLDPATNPKNIGYEDKSREDFDSRILATISHDRKLEPLTGGLRNIIKSGVYVPSGGKDLGEVSFVAFLSDLLDSDCFSKILKLFEASSFDSFDHIPSNHLCYTLPRLNLLKNEQDFEITGVKFRVDILELLQNQTKYKFTLGGKSASENFHLFFPDPRFDHSGLYHLMMGLACGENDVMLENAMSAMNGLAHQISPFTEEITQGLFVTLLNQIGREGLEKRSAQLLLERFRAMPEDEVREIFKTLSPEIRETMLDMMGKECGE